MVRYTIYDSEYIVDLFWTAPASDHEGIIFDVNKVLYQIYTVGLRFVCIRYLRKLRVTLCLSLRKSQLPNSCKGCHVFWYKCVYIKLPKERSSVYKYENYLSLNGK
jgi:hypothetical protein